MDDVATTDLHNHDPRQHLSPPTDPELQSSVRPLNHQSEPQEQDIPGVEVEQHDAEQLENGSRPQPISLTPGSGNDGLGQEVDGVDLPLSNEAVLMDHHHHNHHHHHHHHGPDPSTPSNSHIQPDLHHGYLVPGNKQIPISTYPLPQSLPQSFIPHFQSPPQPVSSPVVNASQNDGYFKNMKLIADPPDLDKWRERLFNVEDTIVLSEEEYVLNHACHRYIVRIAHFIRTFTGFRPISRTWTTSIPIALRRNTSANRSYPTIGIVD